MLPTQHRWLDGLEYAFLLRHHLAYTSAYPEMTLTDLNHPNQAYSQPTNGLVYFIRGWHLREFGFPRAENVKKVFKWKKMNFTTDLPKNDPICTYLVSSSRVSQASFRMHVVTNSKEYNKEYRNSDILKQLKMGIGEGLDKKKLLPEDRNSGNKRVIVCHVL